MELALENQKLNGVFDPEIEEMIRSGVHLGHAKSKSHPSMKPYIYGIRNNISVIDVTKTKENLSQAVSFFKEMVARGGLILLVGTRPSAKNAIKEAAGQTNMPFVNERWIGGALTNFKVISGRVSHLEELEREKASGGFEKYTKKEKMLKEEEIANLNKMFDGLRLLKRLPDALFVVDITEDDTAVREARRKKVPIVALVDTNTDAGLVDWPIPSNDDALPAVRYMVGRIKEAILEGQKMAKEKTIAEKETEEKKKEE